MKVVRGVMRWSLASLVSVVLTLLLWTYLTQASHNFTDVPDSLGAFHSAVEWMKNRAITSGCTTTAYCPNDPLTRAQMALFMQRLGGDGLLTPKILHASGFLAAPAIAACPTTAHTPTFPQQAIIHSRVSTTSAGVHEHHSLTKVSTDGGRTWAATDSRPFSINGTGAGLFAHTTYFTTFDLSPGTSYMFGVEIGIMGSGVSAGRHVQVEIINRNPTTGMLQPVPPITEEQKRRP